MARVLVPIPSRDFDPTEVAVPWHVLSAQNHDVVFATPDGKRGFADPLMVTGRGLDLWGFVPGLDRLAVIGRTLRASRPGRDAYARLERDPAFLQPRTYASLKLEDYDALVLPGGHRARGMRAYLEDAALQSFVADFFDAGKPVGAICHGVLLAANAISKRTGKSVLWGRKTTSLTWALESLGWTVGRVFRFWDPDYYRTYLEAPGEPKGYRSVQSDVARVLASPEDYCDVPEDAVDRRRKTSGRHRDTATDHRPSFVVRDGNYVSARWPGDAHAFASTLADVLAERTPQVSATPSRAAFINK
jgi:putative intracellular protease/amidase